MVTQAPAAPRRRYKLQVLKSGDEVRCSSFRDARSLAARALGKVFWSPWQEGHGGVILSEAYLSLEDFWYHRNPAAVIVTTEGGPDLD